MVGELGLYNLLWEALDHQGREARPRAMQDRGSQIHSKVEAIVLQSRALHPHYRAQQKSIVARCAK